MSSHYLKYLALIAIAFLSLFYFGCSSSSDSAAVGNPHTPEQNCEIENPQSGGQQLRKELCDLRDQVLVAYDYNIVDTTKAYGNGSVYRNNPAFTISEWSSMVFDSLRMSVDLVSTSLNFSNLNKDEFFSGSSITNENGELSSVADHFGKGMSAVDDQTKSFQGDIFLAGLFGDFQNLGSYDLFPQGYSNLSKKADELYGPDKGNVNTIANDMRPIIESSSEIQVARRSGKMDGQRPSIIEWSPNLNDARTKIEDGFDTLIGDIPETLPEGFPLQQTLGDLTSLTQDLEKNNGGENTGEHIIRFQAVAFPDGQKVEPRKVSLGVISEYNAIEDKLTDAVSKNLEIRQNQVISDAKGLELNAVSSYDFGAGSGDIATVVDGVSLANAVGGLGDQGQTVIPEHQVRPISAMSENELAMTLKLGEQSSNLWAIADGTEGYIKYLLKNTPGSEGAGQSGGPKIKWKFETGGTVKSSPAFSNGTVYFGSDDKNLYALEASSGNKIWSFKTENSISIKPTLDNNIIFFGSQPNFYAVDAATGKEKWRYTDVPFNAFSDASIVDGKVFFGEMLVDTALAEDTGQKLWQYNTGNFGVSSPVINNGLVFVEGNNRIIAVPSNAACSNTCYEGQGKETWIFKTDSDFLTNPIRTPMIFVNNMIIFGGGDNLFALDAASGKKMWVYKCNGSVKDPVLGNGKIIFNSDDGVLHSVDATSGQENWEIRINATSVPAFSNNDIYMGVTTNDVFKTAYYLVAIDSTNGKEMWRFGMNKEIESTPYIENNTAYFGDDDNYFYAVSMPD
ncbi:MAG: PQQ-binding-like beta-propeller repeat protein [Actinobacteria bacterium]|nr:PQQ-binding-like beta-propeller repeat protein [Actinomycetota bacterium]